MDPRVLLEKLLNYERRVRHLYLQFGERSDFSPDMKLFWKYMAEDERHHLDLLERSSGFVDMVDKRLEVTEEVLAEIDKLLATAEKTQQQTNLSMNDALQLALLIEGSEVNSLDATWLSGFRSPIGSLLQSMLPEEEVHIRRLVEAINQFSQDKALREQSVELWVKYQKERKGLRK